MSPRELARLATLVENGAPLSDKDAAADGRGLIVGVTGPPGAGKSSLVDALIAEIRRRENTVAIIAVDPSSRATGGAILGDRVRMQRHHADPGVFIRSMATRGFLGGLSQATRDTTLLLDAAGKQIILVETVGVGQGEIEIVRLADCTIVVLMPGMGDDVQSLKAGLMEIGDIFVLNKSDREGADRFEQQLKGILQLVPERDGWKPPVVRTIATENKGVAELGRQIELFRKHFEQAHERQAREVAHWKEWILQLLETRLMERVAGKYLGEKELDRIAAAVAERKTDPYAAVNEILARAGLGETR